ncbi:MAG: Ig-like domain-containing protein [Tissierellales bacterium]|jgi:hypothetical protein|nr:Ig-like domain-containing protein [Tissierellales bacterium]
MFEKRGKVCAFLVVLSVFLCLFGSISVGAEESWTEWEQKSGVDSAKVWTVVFSKTVDESSVSSESIYVKNSNGDNVTIISELDDTLKKIMVKPEANYELGKTYTLYITGLKSQSGLDLKSDIKMDFVISSGDVNNNLKLAENMDEFVYNFDLLNNHYDENVAKMAETELKTQSMEMAKDDFEAALEPSTTIAIKTTVSDLIKTNVVNQNIAGIDIPSEFTNPLPAGGVMPAPPGACPAAANPQVTFANKGGATITPELLSGISSIPSDMILQGQSQFDSVLQSAITNPLLAMELANPEGWNTNVWDKLSAKRQTLTSLLDYQVWTVASDIESQVVTQFRSSIASAQQLPETVLAAFDASNKNGWFYSKAPTASDSFGRMDIEAELTGSITGTVYEQRGFNILGAGQLPVYTTQTGYGTIYFTHPELGLMTFDVNIALDEFDVLGRAVAGTVTANGTGEHSDYSVVFNFKSDGTKEGQVYEAGNLVGRLTMSVDAVRFENYIDVESEEEFPLEQ